MCCFGEVADVAALCNAFPLSIYFRIVSIFEVGEGAGGRVSSLSVGVSAALATAGPGLRQGARHGAFAGGTQASWNHRL